MTKNGTYGTVVLNGVLSMFAPGVKVHSGYIIVKGGEYHFVPHGDVVDFLPVAEPDYTVFDAKYRILYDE